MVLDGASALKLSNDGDGRSSDHDKDGRGEKLYAKRGERSWTRCMNRNQRDSANHRPPVPGTDRSMLDAAGRCWMRFLMSRQGSYQRSFSETPPSTVFWLGDESERASPLYVCSDT